MNIFKKMTAVLLAAVMLLAMTACGKSGPSDQVESDIKDFQKSDVAEALVDEKDLSDENKESYTEFLKMLRDFDYSIEDEQIAEDGNSATVKLVITSYDFGTAYLDTWDEIIASKKKFKDDNDFYRVFFENMLGLKDKSYVSEVTVTCTKNEDGNWTSDLAKNSAFAEAVFGGMIGIVNELANA